MTDKSLRPPSNQAMPGSFQRTTQSLRGDAGRLTAWGAVIGLLLLTGWLTWALKARVNRYEVSQSARLEVHTAAAPVQADLSGRLLRSELVLGRSVQAGEVLAELDAEPEQLSLQEERTRFSVIEPEIAALRAQIQAENAGDHDDKSVLQVSTGQSLAQYREAEAQAEAAEMEAHRAASLRKDGIIAPQDAERLEADARSKRAAADSLKLAASRLEPELHVRERDRDVRLKQIVESETKLEAERLTSQATIQRLQYEVQRRTIRAAISGRLGECPVLAPGSHISEGQQLGVILPEGDVHVVAEFAPAAALGKIRPGQQAVVRLDGFPWAQYGTVAATVSEVADDLRDGKVHVELAVNSAPHSRIPLQHGLPGTVEVLIERATPMSLLLRSAGALAGAH